MVVRKIAENIFYVGVDDNISEFFEGIWPIPNGITYNTYLILDDKVALIEGGVKKELGIKHLSELETLIDLPDIDYIIVNHSEPDHTGSLPLLYRLTKAKIYASKMGITLLKNFYGLSGDRLVDASGKLLDLGNTKLRFISTPGVHWPDSMVTYDETHKILFSSDIFGVYGSLKNKIFADENDFNLLVSEAKRYFVNIIGKFVANAKRALKSIETLNLKIVAPAHGPVWRNNIEELFKLYNRLVEDSQSNKVVLLYGSMYGFSEALAHYITQRLMASGIQVELINASKTHPSFSISEIWDAQIVIFGGPTYDNAMFPPIMVHAYYLKTKNLRNKKYAIFGSHGWSGRGYRELQEVLSGLGWELIEPIIDFKGRVVDETKKKVDELVDNIVSAIGE